MKTQLLEKGSDGRRLRAGDGRPIEGEEMKRLCHTLASMEEALIALERRGISLKAHAERMDFDTGTIARLPRLLSARRSTGSPPAQKLDEFLQQQERGDRAGGWRSANRRPDAAERRRRNGEPTGAPAAHHRTARSAHDQRRLEGSGRNGLRHPVADSAGADGHRGSALRPPPRRQRDSAGRSPRPAARRPRRRRERACRSPASKAWAK